MTVTRPRSPVPTQHLLYSLDQSPFSYELEQKQIKPYNIIKKWTVIKREKKWNYWTIFLLLLSNPSKESEWCVSVCSLRTWGLMTQGSSGRWRETCPNLSPVFFFLTLFLSNRRHSHFLSRLLWTDAQTFSKILLPRCLSLCLRYDFLLRAFVGGRRVV